MSTTKSHTKNELARISAKIQQLKRKYPVSSELFQNTFNQNNEQKEKTRIKQQLSTLQSKKQSLFSEHNSDLKSKSKAYIMHNESENFHLPSGHAEVLSSKKILKEESQKQRKSQSCYKNATNNKENELCFENKFNAQKPFKQYKEQLRNLKKCILSSLDIGNFEVSRIPLQQLNQNTNHQQNQHEYIRQKESFCNISQNLQQNQFGQRNHSSSHENQNFQTLDDLHLVQDAFRQNSINGKFASIPFSQQSEEMIFLKASVLKIQQQFISHKQEMSQRIGRIQLQTSTCSQQNRKQRNDLHSVEMMVENLEQKLSTNYGSQFDLKIVQIQNQSITKFAKQFSKQIESVKNELQGIKNHTVSLQNSYNSNNSQNQLSISEKLLNYIQKEIEFKSKQIQDQNASIVKQIQCKFFRQIFDIKNDIELMNQKLKRQDYLEKTLKSLIPNTQTNQQFSFQTLQLLKQNILQDEAFLEVLKSAAFSDFNSKFYSLLEERTFKFASDIVKQQVNQITSKIQDHTRKIIQSNHFQVQSWKNDVLNKVLGEVQFLSNSFKEHETKMISYGLLISNLQENLKEKSQQKCRAFEFKQELFLEVSKMIDLKLQTRAIDQKKQQMSQQIESNGSRILNVDESSRMKNIEPYSMQLHKSTDEIEDSKLSIFTTQEASQKCCFLSQGIKMSNQSMRINFQSGEKPKSNLLDQLIQNSLVFNALKDFQS